MFHVAPIVMPSDLEGRSNGELALALLAPADRGALHVHAARSWAAMAEAAARDGITLRATSAVDTYRTLTRQTAAFRERYTRTPHPGRPTKQWQGVTWWLLPGMAPTATPGTSNHGWGLAIDVCTVGELGQPVALAPSGNPTSIARRAWDWLVDHYESYGWSHEYSSPGTEPWHIRYVPGDETPPALIPPEPTPQPEPIPDEEDDVTRYTYRDTRYHNVWLIPDALHLSPVVAGKYGDLERVEDLHDVMLKSLVNCSGIEMSDLVPV